MLHPPQALQVLQGAQRSHASAPVVAPSLVIAGATGALGNEVLRRLVGSIRYGNVQVLAREPVRAGMARVSLTVCPGDDPARWPTREADVAVVMFEPPRMFYERERALWLPTPQSLTALASWFHRCGVRTLVVVMPHRPGHLPGALQQGFASLDEQSISALGFERLVWVRNAQTPPEAPPLLGWWSRLGAWVLSVFSYMVPQSQQPLRTSHLAHAVSLALHHAPAGVHVLGHEQVWKASHGDMAQAAAHWFGEKGR